MRVCLTLAYLLENPYHILRLRPPLLVSRLLSLVLAWLLPSLSRGCSPQMRRVGTRVPCVDRRQGRLRNGRAGIKMMSHRPRSFQFPQWARDLLRRRWRRNGDARRWKGQ